MKWPRGIYVATKNLGVYYSDDFTDPATQPIWTAVNTGLANIGCREFKVDPFDGENRQYVLTASDQVLYRRDNQGSWASILTPAAVDTLLSTSDCGIASFCVDPSTPGRLWALVGSKAAGGTPNGYWAIYSDNYGASWTATTKVYDYALTYGTGTIRANGNNIWCPLNVGAGNSGYLYYSYNGGASWSFINYGNGAELKIWHNPLEPGRIYFANIDHILRFLESGIDTATNGYCDRANAMRMWFDAADADHQRAIYNQHLLVTEDRWNTYTDIGALSLSALDIARYSGAGDQMLVACQLDIDYQPHVVGAMAGEVTTVTGIAGAMAATSPYTNSIPKTCGGACIDGVQGVRALGVVKTHGVAMPDYAGDSRGEPQPGDRAAWEASNYPARHADDADLAGGIHHTLGTGVNQAASGKTVDDHINDLTNPHEVTKTQVGLGNVENILDNLSAATGPTTGDDSALGYAVGSKWIDTTADKAYVCLDATEGAAVWQEVGAGGGGSGDMLKSTYDRDDDGVVDEAEAVDGVDAAGNSKYYGTDGAGTPGFHSLSSLGGWIEIPDGSWSYASATTINVPSGAASIYSDGDFVRLKQGGAYKQFYITAVADTLLYVYAGSVYTVANAAITDAAFSKGRGTGFPNKFAYDASPSGFSSFTQEITMFSMNRRVVHVYADIGGVSNATTTSFKVPVRTFSGYILQGWVFQPSASVNPTLIEGAGSTFNVYKDGAVTAWASSGSKRIILNFSYMF